MSDALERRKDTGERTCGTSQRSAMASSFARAMMFLPRDFKLPSKISMPRLMNRRREFKLFAFVM